MNPTSNPSEEQGQVEARQEEAREKLKVVEGLYPDEVFQKHPELLRNEVVTLEGQSAIAVDFPKFSTLMSTPETASIGVGFLNEFYQKVGEIREQYEGITLIKSAGDELLFVSEENGLVDILFSLEIQEALDEMLVQEEYHAVREVLKDPITGEDPEIHIGIDSPLSDSNERLKLKLIEFQDDEGNVSRTDLMTMCKVLQCKKLAKEFIVDSDVVFPQEGEARNVVETLRRVGYELEELTEDEKGHLGVQNPQKTYFNLRRLTQEEREERQEQGVQHKKDRRIEELKRAVEEQELREKPVQRVAYAYTPEEAEKLRKMAPVYAREGGAQYPTNSETQQVEAAERQTKGEAAFLRIQGLDEFIQALDEQQEIPRDLAEKLAIRVGAYVARKATRPMLNEKWHIKETELGGDHTMNLVLLNDVYEAHDFTDEQFEALLESYDEINSGRFKQDMLEALREDPDLLGELEEAQVDLSVIEELVESAQFSVISALTRCGKLDEETPELAWILNEGEEAKTHYAGTELVGGEPISLGARLAYKNAWGPGIRFQAAEARRLSEAGKLDLAKGKFQEVTVKGFEDPISIFVYQP
ncbi:hypothetical protein GF360_03230 [candidate division WWE3 bacterium]|nr:hypothetical protein [candidate division WWE3 bacterium]